MVFWQACSSDPHTVTHSINDKLGHCLTFMVLASGVYLGWKESGYRTHLIWFLVVYGFVIEWVQYYVPNRHFSMIDWSADLLGIWLGFLLYKLILRKLMLKPSLEIT